MPNDKQILYIDLDGVIVDFESGINNLKDIHKQKYIDRYDEAPGIFKHMKPLPGAIKAVKQLSNHYEVFILSTAPWNNSGAWADKIRWIKKYFGSDTNSVLYKRIILTHHKDLNYGDILIDDRTKNGADNFRGEFILFGSELFPNWDTILTYLTNSKNEM